MRFRCFTDIELTELWDGLTMDDGIRYGVPSDSVHDYELIYEIRREAVLRGLPASDSNRWDNVV